MTFREVMRNKTIEEVRSTLAMNLRTIRLSKGIAQERLALDAGGFVLLKDIHSAHKFTHC